MKTPAEILDALWNRASSEGVDYIVYHSAIQASEANLEGWFHPEVTHRKKPQIWLYRTPPPAPSPQNKPDLTTMPLHDCIVLAHEYGHFRSWLDSARGTTPSWQAYFEAAATRERAPKELSVEQRRLILEEEARAWDLGEVVLRELGFEEWADYGRHRDRGLHAHRTLMGIEASQ